MCVNTGIIRPNVVLHFRVLINQCRFRNPLSGRRAETNFHRSSSRSSAPHFYISCFRYDMVPDESSRAAYETRPRGAMLAYTRERAETVNPETRRGRCARLLSRGNELHSRTDTADVICYSRPNHSEKPIDRGPIHFFSSNKPGGHVFLSAIPLGAAIIIGAVAAIHLIVRQTTPVINRSGLWAPWLIFLKIKSP